MIVPMLQTNGITAYALGSCSGFFTISPTLEQKHESANRTQVMQIARDSHCLDHADVAIERTTEDSSCECNPEVLRESN
jgi:hypothetical protein